MNSKQIKTKRNRTKKHVIISILMIFCLWGMLFAQSGTTQPEAPSNFNQANAGSKQNPYLISNLANLRWLSEYSGEVEMGFKYFEQTANINASETINWNDGKGFKPIGHGEYTHGYDSGNRFLGEYNGAGYTINGICINMSATGTNLSVGLFGVVMNDSIVRNLTLEGVNITAITDIYSSIAGGITGVLQNDSHIINCHASVNIVTTTGIEHSYAGGLVGWYRHNSTIQRSTSSGFVKGDIAGGLVGTTNWANDLTIISHSSSTANVQGYFFAGGISGELTEGAHIFQCDASGNIVAIGDDPVAGGLVGVLRFRSTIKHGNFTGSVYASGRRASAGGIVGGANPYLYPELYTLYHIENCEAQGIVEVFETESTGGYWHGSSAGGIVGSFNGRIKNSDFTGIVKSNYGGGGIAGISHIGSIENCKAEGDIIIDNVIYENGYAGGIVGRIAYIAGAEFLIARCHANSDITATANGLYVGGIIGQAYNLTIENCHANGTITTNILSGRSESTFIGGLAGSLGQDSVIRHSYNTIDTGFMTTLLNANIGGIAGNLNDESPGGGTSDENLLNVSQNIWDKEVSQIDTDVAFNESEGNISDNLGLLTAEMKTSTPYIENGWDFNTIWGIDPMINDGYPYLLGGSNVEPSEFNPPRNLKATQVKETIELSWDLPSSRQLVSFRVNRNDLLIAWNLTSTFFVDEDIDNNTEYSYTVLAVYQNPTGISEPSNEVAVHTLFSPRNLTYTFDENDNVELSWLAPNGGSVNSYLVYRDDELLSHEPSTDLFFIDTTMQPITIYTYKVIAVYDSGESEPIQITLCTSEIPVNPPRNLTASTKDGFVELRWDLPEFTPGFISLNLEHFNVYRNGVLLAEQVVQTLYLDDTAQNQTSYIYVVTAVYTYQEYELTSENSNPAELTVYYPVRNLMATSIWHDVRLNWNPPSEGTISGYNVYRNNTLLNQSILTTNIFTDDNTTPAANYTYEVIAVYSDGESLPVAVSIIVPLLAPPVNLIAKVVKGDIELNWEMPVDILEFEVLLGFDIYRDNEPLNSEPIMDLFYNDVVTVEGIYTYKIIAVYEQGQSESIEIEVNVIDITDTSDLPVNYIDELICNYPNPFNPTTTIKFSTEKQGNVSIDVYNIRGQKVVTLLNGTLEAGEHSVVWSGFDESGRSVGSGVYFYHMRKDDFSEMKRMVLMK